MRFQEIVKIIEDYKSQNRRDHLCYLVEYGLNIYLKPYFEKATFADLNAVEFERFVGWAKEQCYRGKVIENKTVNKIINVNRILISNLNFPFLMN